MGRKKKCKTPENKEEQKNATVPIRLRISGISLALRPKTSSIQEAQASASEEQQQTQNASNNSNNNNTNNNNQQNHENSKKNELITDANAAQSTNANLGASAYIPEVKVDLGIRVDDVCKFPALNRNAGIQVEEEDEDEEDDDDDLDDEEDEDEESEDEEEIGETDSEKGARGNHVRKEGKNDLKSMDEENDSPSEDEKDSDWTPAGIKARCMRRTTRAATLKSRQGGARQTRARARILTPQPQKRKASVAADIRKAPYDWVIPSPSESEHSSVEDVPTKPGGDKIRPCMDCDERHQAGECLLYRPLRIIPDEQASPKDEFEFSKAERSLPKMLKLVTMLEDHGPSVVTRVALEQYTQFGPLVGQIVDEADIHEDMDMKDIWEVFHENIKFYLETCDPNASNWMRYLRPAPSKSERNLSAVAFQDCLYFVTVKAVPAGTELTYWSEDPTVTWSKKKIEKTSCGGCNQKFSHPLYYRMHCMIFHDPNYSLTIRKYHCKICGIAVLGKENIMKHAAEMHEGKGAYQCQYCKKFFLRLNYLDMHRTYGCKMNPRRSRPLCDLCGKKFCQPQKLKVHIRRMHSDISEVLKEFQCKSCFKLLGSRAALQRHLKEVHNKDQNIAATCDRCGKTFQNKSNLKIHMLTHSGVKPFRCTENSCTAAFTTKQCLQFHYKKVHGYTIESMPSIERCIAYTFESYSGGQGEDGECGEVPANGEGAHAMADAMAHAMAFVNQDSIPSMSSASDMDDSSMCSSNMVAFPGKEGILLPPTAVPVQPGASADSMQGENSRMASLEALALEPCHVAGARAERGGGEYVEGASEAPESRPEEKDMQLGGKREAESPGEAPLLPPSLPRSKTGGGVEDGGRDGVERMDSSDVELNTDVDDNVSERSLELGPRSGTSQRQQSVRSAESYGAAGGRLLGKEDGKEYTSEMVASMACEFAMVRHYAASLSAQQQSDYAMQLRHHMEAGGAMEQMERQEDEEMAPGASGAEDLSRYEMERGTAAVKAESGDELSEMCEDLTKRRMAPADPNDLLVVVPDDDEDEEEAPSPRDDAAMVLAQHEHSINQFLRHQAAALSSHRDLERLPIHSLDLSLPRTTVHLLEHLARTTAAAHSMEHASSRQMSSSPEDAAAEHLPRQLPFHGMDSLPRPLPHRLDHLPHGMEHMARSPSSSQQEGDSGAHGMEHLSRQATSHALEGIAQNHVPYVVDHLSRIPESYARGSMEALGRPAAHSLDNLSRAGGMEFLARLSPLPRTHRLEAMARSFTYSMEHADAYLLQHGGAAEHLPRPPSHVPPQYAGEQRATPHSLDLSTSRNMDSPQSQHEGGGNARAASPQSYQECSPPTPSSSSSSYQAGAATSSAATASTSHPTTQSSAPTSSVHSNYPTYLEYY